MNSSLDTLGISTKEGALLWCNAEDASVGGGGECSLNGDRE